MFENREIDGWFVKSERLQGKKHRNTCCIPRIFDAAAAAFCRKRRLFRFFKQPLISIGIDSPEKLIETGSEQAFLKLKEAYPRVCLVYLYTLEGAIQNIEFNCLPEDRKKELKAFSDQLKKKF